MKKTLQFVSIGLLSVTMASAITPTATAIADTYSNSTVIKQEPVVKDGYRIFLYDGKVVKWPADQPEPTTQQLKVIAEEKGKWGTAIKLIRKGYKKLPKNIRQYINKYIGLHGILKFLDHWTGSVEDGIYKACRKAGMPTWMARAVAKAITFVLL